MSLELIKSSVEQIGTGFAEFKATLATSTKEKDSLLETKLAKIADDITAKHEATQKLIDSLEARLQRPSQSDGAAVTKEQEHAILFAKHRSTGRGFAVEPDVDVTKAYYKAFMRWARIDTPRLSPEEHKDMSVGSDPDGGYWILPPTIATEVVRRMFETSPVRQVASVMSIGTREYVIPEDPNDVGAGWVAERGPVTTTTSMQIGKKAIVAHEMYAEPVVTTQMLEDAAIDLEAYLADKISDKLARVSNTAFVNGTGSGQPRGLLTYASGTTWGSQIEQVGTGSSGAFTYAGLINLITSIKDKYQGNAQFLIRRQSIASIMTLTDGASRLIFQPILNGAFNTTPLLGYKINYATDMPAVGAGALSLAFGDFGAAYQIVDRVGMSTIRDNLTSKPNALFYTRARVGGDVKDFDAYKLQVLT